MSEADERKMSWRSKIWTVCRKHCLIKENHVANGLSLLICSVSSSHNHMRFEVILIKLNIFLLPKQNVRNFNLNYEVLIAF